MDYGRFGLPDFHAVPRRDYFLAILSGVLLALSFPKAGLSLLAWVSLVPLLLATSRKTPKKAFKLGFVAGMTAYCGILYWVNIVMTTYGKLPVAASVVLWLLLSAYLGLFPGVVIGLVRRGEERGITPLLTLPLLWTGLEYLRGFLLSGFPWALLGYSQYRWLPLIQIADITGVYGISFLIVLANVLLYRIIRGAVVKDMVGYPVKTTVVFIIALTTTISYGYKRLHQQYDGNAVKVALIQGNIDQNIKWDPAFQEATVKVYERLSRQACAARPDLVVWPESAVPFYFQDDLLYAERLKKLARETKSCVLFGSPAYEKMTDRVRYLNSAFLLSPSGDIVGRGDKMHLVPFGEYVPLARFMPFVHKLVAGIGDFSAGERVVTLKTSRGDIGALICFEGIFPELARAYVKAGSGLLVSITNDAWFGRSSAPYQHLSMTAFRAVENRVPLVRAANTGISAIIEPTGRIVKTTALFEEATLTGEVKLRKGDSLYNRYGDVFAFAATVVSAVIIILMYVRKPPVFRKK